jgi:hypothetical protein
MPPLERLNELFEVVEIPEDKFGKWSGLVWKVRRGGKANAGSVAGTPSPHSGDQDRVDWRVKVDGADYLASRVIYYMAYREDPGDVTVDHEDQNWLNNNAGNLRLDVDGDIQDVNKPMYRNNTSGVVGVYWNKATGKWHAQVRFKGKDIYLGLYACKIEAACVVNEKWIKLGWDKLGRKLNDLNQIRCDCGKCSASDDGPT